jgi:threonine aldolase
MAHTYRWEGGGAAVLGSVQPQPLAHNQSGARWRWQTSKLPSNPTTAITPVTRLLALENTWNGKLLPFAYLEQATVRWPCPKGWHAIWMVPGCSMRLLRRPR